MYDLPKGITFDFLKNRELELLCFGPYTVTLHFDGGIQLQIEGSFTHIIAGQGRPPEASRFPLPDSRLVRLLTQSVSEVKVKRNGTLTLGFGNGDTLIVDGNVGPYESYNVNRPDAKLLVV